MQVTPKSPAKSTAANALAFATASGTPRKPATPKEAAPKKAAPKTSRSPPMAADKRTLTDHIEVYEVIQLEGQMLQQITIKEVDPMSPENVIFEAFLNALPQATTDVVQGF